MPNRGTGRSFAFNVLPEPSCLDRSGLSSMTQSSAPLTYSSPVHMHKHTDPETPGFWPVQQPGPVASEPLAPAAIKLQPDSE